MGRLIEQQIATLYQGVSRQPDPVRLAGQVEEGDDVHFSIVTGGFEKRAQAARVAQITGLTASDELAVYGYDRDSAEQYIVTIDLTTPDIRVHDLDGNEKTVTTPDGVTYLSSGTPSPDDFSFATLADTTIIANRKVTTAMDGSTTPSAPPSAAAYHVKAARAGVYAIDIDGTEEAIFTATGTSTTKDIADDLVTDLGTNLGAGWTVTQQGSYFFVEKDDGSDFTTVTRDPLGEADMVVAHDTIRSSSELPSRAVDGMVVSIGEDEDTIFYMAFTETESSTNRGYWSEVSDPDRNIRIDATTMPYKLVRGAGGSFTFSKVTWDDAAVGSSTSVPDPDFIGFGIRAVAFFRNRLCLLSEETINLSRSGDFFNFWPERSTAVLDTDPFGRTSTSDEVSLFNFATQFQKALLITSEKSQFELTSPSGQLLTPDNAELSETTNFRTSALAKPIAFGDNLYFSADNGGHASFFEYYLSEDAFLSTAEDVTKHVGQYVPAGITDIAGDPATGTVWLLKRGDTKVYVYKTFWRDQEKVQSSWGCWNIAGVSAIKGMRFLDGKLYLVATDSTEDEVEIMVIDPNHDGKEANESFQVRLDRRVRLTGGTYDSSDDHTTWTVPYQHQSLVELVTDETQDSGKRGVWLKPSYPSTTTIRIDGDWSAGGVYVGFPYTSDTQLSKLYPRTGSASEAANVITAGRNQIRDLTVTYQNTGRFFIRVTAKGRTAKDYLFAGRILGDSQNIIGQPAVASLGEFTAKVNSRGSEAQINIMNDSPFPHRITQARWRAFFNETTRQE